MSGVRVPLGDATRSFAHRAPTVALLGVACALAVACASARPALRRDLNVPSSEPARAVRSAATVLGDAELASVTAQTAFDAIRQLRPEFLQASPVASGLANQAPSVYIGDSYLGGVSSLNEIPLSEIAEIRYLRPFDAVERLGAGCRCSGGVILIRWRRRE